MAEKKKPLLSPPSNVQLISNFERSTKALRRKGAGMIIFFWINAQNIDINLYCFCIYYYYIVLGGRSSSCIPLGDNKA